MSAAEVAEHAAHGAHADVGSIEALGSAAEAAEEVRVIDGEGGHDITTLKLTAHTHGLKDPAFGPLKPCRVCHREMKDSPALQA